MNAAKLTRQLLKARLFFEVSLLTLAIYNSQAFAVSEKVPLHLAPAPETSRTGSIVLSLD